VIVGPTGVGKSYSACALAHHAIREGHRALYLRIPRLLDDLAPALARGDGRLSRVMSSLARVDVLVLDAFLRPLSNDEAVDLLEVIEDRSNRSIIVTSQLLVKHWHDGLGDPTIADATPDRLLERGHEKVSTGGQLRSPPVAMKSPRWWPREVLTPY
jgi:DNA replication protein DnaC